MSTLTRCLVLALALLLCLGSFHSVAAQEPAIDGLPSGWSQLPADQFVDAVLQLKEQGPLSDEASHALESHAARFLTETNIVQAGGSYWVIDQLHRMARHELSKDQTEAMRETLLARQDAWQGREFTDLRAKLSAMRRVGVPFEVLRSDAVQWIQAGGDLSAIPSEDVGYLRFFFPDVQLIEKNFSIRWEGRVSAPQTGQYTFSISPININKAFGGFYMRKTVTVTVGGQRVITATPEDWSFVGTPITLTQNQPVPLRVDLTLESSDLMFSELHATLLWQGPGVAKSIVPSSRLSTPEGAAEGLQATYSWIDEGQPQSITRIEPNIDSVWPVGRIAVGATSQYMLDRLAAEWQQAIDPAFLNTLTGPPAQVHPFVPESVITAGDLTSAQRKQFLEVLLDRPQLLDALNLEQAIELYRAYRVGAEDEALDVFGTWAMRNPDLMCEMPHDPKEREFNEHDRMTIHRLGVCLGHELPSHADRLRDEYLVLADGSCSLPVAYALASAYRVQGNITAWIGLLDDYLADPAVSGDRRVNWLLARAYAGSHPAIAAEPFFYLDTGNVGPDNEWLQEATLIASAPEIKLRVLRERAARLAFSRRFDDAQAVLQDASNIAPQDYLQTVSEWIDAVAGFEIALQELQLERAALREEAFINAYIELRDNALGAGDAATAAQYDALLQEAAEN